MPLRGLHTTRKRVDYMPSLAAWIKKSATAVADFFGGATRNRTGDEGFADLCLTAWLWRRMGKLPGVADYGALNRGSTRKSTNCAERKTEPTRALNRGSSRVRARITQRGNRSRRGLCLPTRRRIVARAACHATHLALLAWGSTACKNSPPDCFCGTNPGVE